MWYYNDEPLIEIPEGVVGFVYCITNLENNRKYIGKKNAFFSKTKMVKGKKKKFKVPSDWPTYYGSNKELIADVEAKGEHSFKREILRLCKTKAEMSYFELVEQIDNRVLERDDYYNDWIMVKVRAAHLKL